MIKEMEIQVKTFQVNAHCEVCLERLKFTGGVLASNPPKFEHTCGCDQKVHRTINKYPCFKHEPLLTDHY